MLTQLLVVEDGQSYDIEAKNGEHCQDTVKGSLDLVALLVNGVIAQNSDVAELFHAVERPILTEIVSHGVICGHQPWALLCFRGSALQRQSCVVKFVVDVCIVKAHSLKYHRPDVRVMKMLDSRLQVKCNVL